MAKKSTKHKIIDFAIPLLNEVGFGTITLQEIAEGLGMSRGNLTYHFKDKDALLAVIAQQMWAKIEKERIKSRTFPSFKNIHNEIQLYYKIQKEYAFIFLDPHVLRHPLIRAQFRKMTAQTIADNKAGIAFSIKLGNMKPEQLSGTYHNLAFITWMLSFFWLAQKIIRDDQTEKRVEKLVWTMLLPHFTEKGLQAFKTFFGEAYYNDLGEPFEVDISELIAF